MTPKFYAALWILLAFVALAIYAVGAMTLFAGVAFGFLTFGLIWAGMICVLPGQFGHNAKHADEFDKPAEPTTTATTAVAKTVKFRTATTFDLKRAA